MHAANTRACVAAASAAVLEDAPRCIPTAAEAAATHTPRIGGTHHLACLELVDERLQIGGDGGDKAHFLARGGEAQRQLVCVKELAVQG